MTRTALKIVSSQSAETILTSHWCEASAATWAWMLCPTPRHLWDAVTSWQRLEAGWLLLTRGRM